MKRSKSSDIFRPFEDLEALIQSKSISLSHRPAIVLRKNKPKKSDARPKLPGHHRRPKRYRVLETTDNPAAQPGPEEEKRFFMKAMADVKPVLHDRWGKSNPGLLILDNHEDDTDEALLQLKNLIENGEGFVVADTPEYMEGTGYNVNPLITRRLHRGDYSIQAHIDLHGLGVEAAKNAFESFLKDSILAGKRALLIVHGRGLSSPDKPVIKTGVYEWLTRGPWRKWVVAFSSARLFDGGAGATYVLLRQRPLTKRLRKKKKPWKTP